MEEAEVLRARIDSRPLNVLEACAGMSGSYAVFRDMGYRIGKWHTIEMRRYQMRWLTGCMLAE